MIIALKACMKEVGSEALLTKLTKVCKPYIQLFQCEITEHGIRYSIDEPVLCVFQDVNPVPRLRTTQLPMQPRGIPGHHIFNSTTAGGT
jgi:hypothetical protein